ncbi:High-affinity nitrate transporter 3.2 [Thalictrum thalictroides]|uniref:High-affinity nitrate transporter n=1 Tax=Thalictrum thalictroides TaxID=46969 RepID=A0A7J6VF68_THATH|nr:High-affinity nitrate transporter 3.2 [Thalictrum thalictroides]
MASNILISTLLFFCLYGATCYGKVHFSTLQNSLVVTASPKHGSVIKTGEDKITVTWGLNQSFPASTAVAFHEIKVKLCFAPISQKDRAWRKTKDELLKDKTCQFNVVHRPYDPASDKAKVQSFEWLVERDVPTATYFVRAYAFNSEGHEIAYGQTTDAEKKTNLFDIHGISGRHASINIAAGVFSAFSVVSLCAFFYAEKRKAR